MSFPKNNQKVSVPSFNEVMADPVQKTAVPSFDDVMSEKKNPVENDSSKLNADGSASSSSFPSVLPAGNPFSNPFFSSFQPASSVVAKIGGKFVNLESTAPAIISDRKKYAENLRSKLDSNIPLSTEEFDHVKTATGFDDDLTAMAINNDPNFTAVKTIRDREKNKSDIVGYLSAQDGAMMVVGKNLFPKGGYENYDLEDPQNVERLYARFQSDKKEFEAKSSESHPFDPAARASASIAGDNLKPDSPFIQAYNKLKDWRSQQVADELVKKGITDPKQVGMAIQNATDQDKTDQYWKSHLPSIPSGSGAIDAARVFFKTDTPLQDYELENTGADYLKRSLDHEASRKKVAGEDNQKEIEDYANVVKSQEDLYNKYPDVRYGQIVAAISNAKASEEGLTLDTEKSGTISRIGYVTTAEDVVRLAKENGLYDNPRDKKLVDKIASQENISPLLTLFQPGVSLFKKATAPIENVSFAGQFTEGVKGVVSSTGKSIIDLAQLRGNGTISAEQYNDDVITSWKKDQSNLDTTQRNIALVGTTTGQIVGQALTTLAFSGAGKAASLAQESVENLGFWASGALSSYDDAKKSMLDLTKSDVKAEAGALLIGFVNAASEKIFKDTKVFGDVFGKRVGNILNNIDEDKLFTEATRSAVVKALKSDIPEWTKNYVVEGNKEAFEEFATAVLQDVTEAALGDNKKFDATKTWENARDTYVSMLMGGSLAAGLAARTNIKTNPNAATSLYHASENPNFYISSIQQLKNTNQLSEEEANKKIQIINTATKINSELAGVDGLNARQKAAYISYRTTQAQMMDMASKTTDPVLKAKLDENIKVIDEQKNKILGGLQFNEKLEPLDNLYDQEQKYKKAEQVASESGDAADIDAAKKAKENYANAVSEYYKVPVVDNNATVSSAVINVNGNTYEGSNHAEAILNAKAAGEDISNVDRQGDGMFKLSDGTVINRAEALSRFGKDRSELLIPQNENAVKANLELENLLNNSSSSNTNQNAKGEKQQTQNAQTTGQGQKEMLGNSNATPGSSGVVNESNASALRDTEIASTFDKVKPFLVSDAEKVVAPIIQKINSAENINENDLEPARNQLYDLLDKIDKAPETIYSKEEKQSIANLVEPLINKIENYEFTTTTETSTVTEKVPVKVARQVTERQPVNKSISQWEGNRATVTDANGKKVEGIINSKDGNYYIVNGNGEKVAVLGDRTITDRDITLPSSEQVSQPFEFDENGNIKSMTLQLNRVDKENGGTVPDKLITINFKDKEKALDYAIQLRAEQVGEIPQPEFDTVFEEVQKEYQREVLKNKDVQPEKITPKKGSVIDTNAKNAPLGIAFAPYRERNVNSDQEDAAIRKSAEYQQFQENVTDIAAGLGIKIIDTADTWGGYVDTETGRPVQEVSNIIHVDATADQARLMGAILGKSAPELQDTVLVGSYSDEGSGIEHTIKTGSFENAKKAISLLKENGIEYFTVDTKTGDIIILDLDNSNSDNIIKFANKLSKDGTEIEHEFSPIEANFIGSSDYDGIIGEERGKESKQEGFDIDTFVKQAQLKYAAARSVDGASNPAGNAGQGSNQAASGSNSVQSSVNNSTSTQDFFSNTVNGSNQPKKPWEPLLPLKGALLKAYNIWRKFRGGFDSHIETSIPAFRDVQIRKINAISSILKNGGTVIDLGGSEGGFGKAITSLNPQIHTINLDMNPDMQKAHETNPVKGAEFVKAAFGEDVTLDDGTIVPKFVPKEKADVVHESMLFQFITPERQSFIDEIADNYVKPNGVVLIEEKVIAENWSSNEQKKDSDFKSNYYDGDQIKKKGDEILVGMKGNQAEEPALLKSLTSRFKYVYQYWDAGNFKGYIASNDKAAANNMLRSIGDTKTDFTSRKDLISIEGSVEKNIPNYSNPTNKNAAVDKKVAPIESATKPSTKYQEKAKAIADKIRNAELPQWLVNTESTSSANGLTGLQIKNALADAVEMVGKLIDTGVDIKDAIAKGLESFKKAYVDSNTPFDEKILSDGFTNYVSQQLQAEPTAKDIAESVRTNKVSYNDAILGKDKSFVDELNKELFGSSKFNFDLDSFKEQIRKQKSLGLSQTEIEQLFNTTKQLTKAQKGIIADIFAEEAKTDKLVAELQDAFNKIAQGQKPKSVMERLSISNVSGLVRALKNTLAYTAVSNEQLEQMADYIVQGIDINKSAQYINAMVNNQLSDVKQLLRAKLIIALQQKGNTALATQLIIDMADDATMSGRQTQSLQRAYKILGAQGSPTVRAEFARRAAEAVQEKARAMTESYAQAISEKDAEIGVLNQRLHEKAQKSSLINKIKETIANLCNLRNKK